MTDHRSIATIVAELEAAEHDRREANNRASRLTKELDAARVAEAEATPHEWLGKKVQRQARHGYRHQTITRSGTLTVFDPAKHGRLRNLWRTKAGELIVVSASGLTGYGFELSEYEAKAPATPWELAK